VEDELLFVQVNEVCCELVLAILQDFVAHVLNEVKVGLVETLQVATVDGH